MQYKVSSVEEYLQSMDEERRPLFEALRQTILQNLPPGFKETISYGMVGYVVPHELYPAGYHCDPKLPLPFLSIAAQKNFIALYHMGIYASPELMQWFVSEFPKYSKSKLDMGKSCIRFKKAADVPLELVGKLAQKLTPQDWVGLYEMAFRK